MLALKSPKDFLNHLMCSRVLKALFFLFCFAAGPSACFLTSKKPISKKQAISLQEKAIARDLGLIMSESAELVKDFNRLVSFSLGAMLADGSKMETLGDLTEYTSLFDPIDTHFKIAQRQEYPRFSKEIWNESIYLLQKTNPKFRLRAEGRLNSDPLDPKIESLALVVDMDGDISSVNSEAILSSRQRCVTQTCETTIRIDQKGIANILSKAIKSSSWLGTVGTIVGKVLAEQTTGKVENLTFVNEQFSLKIGSINYVRQRSQPSSMVTASGSVQLKGSVERNFTIEGNLRDPKSLKISFLQDSAEVAK